MHTQIPDLLYTGWISFSIPLPISTLGVFALSGLYPVSGAI